MHSGSFSTKGFFIGDPYTGQKHDTIGIAVGDHPLEVGHEGH
jgi:hypothetical protein